MSGRISRGEFCNYIATIVVLAIVMIGVMVFFPVPQGDDGFFPIVHDNITHSFILVWQGVIAWIYAVFAAGMFIRGGIKRCHDFGQTGWLLLVGLIPWLGLTILVGVLGLMRGTIGPNRYGPDPLRKAAVAE